MIGVTFRAMAMGFVRDRGAVAMSVVLPVIVFLVFAAIFSGASGQNLRINVAIADEQRSEESTRLLTGLGRDPGLVIQAVESEAEALARVASGSVDVAMIVRAGSSLREVAGDGEPPIAIRYDPIRQVAAQVLAGQVQKAYFAALPDVALGSVADLLGQGFVEFTPGQRDSLERRFAELRQEIVADLADGREADGGPLDGLLSIEAAGNAAQGRNHVGYYAGAIAMLFLLFSAVHGALTLFDERDSGLLDRILAGPGGMTALLGGKFLFLVVQGIGQVSLIFLIAWAAYQVPVGEHPTGFAMVTIAAAIAAAGLALVLTTACRTKRQAQTIANVVILLMSALGGSMVPRFLMPATLQTLGWLTPTTWAVEAYSALLWRGEPASAVLGPVALLVAAGGVGVVVAWLLARRAERL
ncbi:MAG: ABC transporter permease [Gemmatimonadales bacterium]